MHPVAIHLGDIPIYWYGIFMATGFLLGFWTAARRGLIRQVNPDTVLNLGPWLVIGALLGARIWYVLTFWDDQFSGKPLIDIFKIRDGGLVFHGGLIGALVGGSIYGRRTSASFLRLADIMTPSIALGHFFGRLGCFMTGCCYGRPADVPWAVHFPEDHATHGESVHPAQIYSSLLNLGLYLALAWIYRKQRKDGWTLASYLMIYSVTRSIAESFRGDSPAHSGSGWSPGVIMSVALMVAGLALAITLYFRPGPREQKSSASGS